MIAPTPTESDPITFPFASLPVGAKVGDELKLIIESIDASGRTATLGFPKGDAGPTDDLPPGAEPADLPGGNDTDVLLGPMNGLKNYLVRKTQNKSREEAT